ASLYLTTSPHTHIFFLFNAPAPTQTYTLSLHDALPISPTRSASVQTTCSVLTPASRARLAMRRPSGLSVRRDTQAVRRPRRVRRSEEHTSELQSRENLVCRLLLEKKKKTKKTSTPNNKK